MGRSVDEQIARNPNVLPSFARQFSLRLEAMGALGPGAAFDAIDVPDELRAAVPQRQRQFRAGRFCAMRALEALAPGRRFETLPRTGSGAPAWPDGITGSITHTGDFVSAAVALTRDVRAMGIDSERLIAGAQMDHVATAVASPAELGCVTTGWTRAEAITFVFSAKESIFKCLHRLVGRMFDYHDVRIASVNAVAGTFRARLVTSLSPRFPAETMLAGRFELDDPWIHTGMFLPADPRDAGPLTPRATAGPTRLNWEG
jgi:enterobactin synthetase component D